ncbi:TPA: PTS sugar transporter subunit IIB, partial [Streptococcus agalactiae]
YGMLDGVKVLKLALSLLETRKEA